MLQAPCSHSGRKNRATKSICFIIPSLILMNAPYRLERPCWQRLPNASSNKIYSHNDCITKHPVSSKIRDVYYLYTASKNCYKIHTGNQYRGQLCYLPTTSRTYATACSCSCYFCLFVQDMRIVSTHTVQMMIQQNVLF